jgi:hypothetical protein
MRRLKLRRSSELESRSQEKAGWACQCIGVSAFASAQKGSHTQTSPSWLLDSSS